MYPELFSLGPLTVYSYGVLLAASYLLGLQLARARARRWKVDPNRVLDLGIYTEQLIALVLGHPDRIVAEGHIGETGVDFISVGAITHSAPTLDFSLLLEPA